MYAKGAFSATKSVLWESALGMWYKDAIEAQATEGNGYEFSMSQERITAGAAHVWPFMESNVKADIDVEARGGERRKWCPSVKLDFSLKHLQP